MVKKFLVFVVLLPSIFLLVQRITFVTQQSMKVFQPKYNFEFEVYRTEDMPANWYKTYDEYYVTKVIGGNWVYGNANGKSMILTDILVGSVNPEEVKELKPALVSTPSAVYIPPKRLRS
jgi:hypothetical protein